MAGDVPMSVRRLIGEVDVGSVNVSAFCVEHGIGRSSFYAIRRRFAAEGEAGLERRSRAAELIANKTPVETENEIVRLRKRLDDDGLDAGPATIRWHLEQDWDRERPVPSEATIWRILKAGGFIVADPSKRPKRSFRSFAAERANEVWQIDGTTWALADQTEVKIINIIDDGSRFWVAGQAHDGETFDAVWSTSCVGAAEIGWPQRFLCDNGRGLAKLERTVAHLGIGTRHSKPYHPQTCGKVERFHQTLKLWLAKQTVAHTLAELQDQLDRFRQIYNHERPHRAIGRLTPASRWDQMPKTGPASHPLTLPSTISNSTVSKAGRLYALEYRIALGAAHATQQATTIITGTTAHVFIDGELIRELTLNPTQTDQPLYQKPGRPKTTP